ncbi:MAG: thioesterase family protein [Phycisphaerae bacterium]
MSDAIPSSTSGFSITRRVHFHETDMAGVMYFANYFRLMEEVEQAFFRSLGFAVAMIEPSGGRMGFPRVNVGCEYFEPAHFDDVLELRIVVTKMGTKSLTYEVDFVRDGRRIAVGRLTGVCCLANNGELKSIEIPPEVRVKLEPHVTPRGAR